MSKSIRPVLLMILDGWGYSENTDCNAIHKAVKPTWDYLWSRYPHTLLRASGAEVGLPSGQMGNSEVGHLNMGAGRVVYQEFTRVCRAIKTGSFFSNQTLTKAVDQAISQDKALHILGLLSPGGVHSHEGHIHAMLELAHQRGAKRIYLHIFTDGRDTPPRSAKTSIEDLERKCQELGSGQLCSIVGRFYAMDRDHRWLRIKASYDLLTQGLAEFVAPDALTALNMAYQRGETDEFVQATAIRAEGAAPVRMETGDVVVFMNYRSDRARQITRPFIEPDFDGFERLYIPQLGQFVTLTEYNKNFHVPVAFPPDRMRNGLGEYLAQLGLHQLRIAETEKYAHVTFFFNGGREQPFEGEDRILIPSPQIATYDLKPEMSAFEVTDKLVEAILSKRYDTIICNYANADMVGHTGSFSAAVKAIEAIDQCLARVLAALQSVGGEMLITADHGNAEQMCGLGTGQPHTAHTSEPVPLIYVGERSVKVGTAGILSDLAPTVLHLMGLPQPVEMTGKSVITLQPQ